MIVIKIVYQIEILLIVSFLFVGYWRNINNFILLIKDKDGIHV